MTDLPRIRLRARSHTPLSEVARTLFRDQRQRTLVGLVLMASQAFFYNAIFFTYALVLTDFYGIRSDQVGWYLLPFAVGNFLGPVFLGRFFDTIGRRPMIAATYAVSGVLLAVTGYLFAIGILSAVQQTVAWMVIFFFASAAASSAYLTVSETFPLEIRALAIAFFYAIGTGIGGVAGPWLFGLLIDTGSRWSVVRRLSVRRRADDRRRDRRRALLPSPPSASRSKRSAGRWRRSIDDPGVRRGDALRFRSRACHSRPPMKHFSRNDAAKVRGQQADWEENTMSHFRFAPGLSAAALAVLLAGVQPVAAQQYPSQSITIIVAAAAGGFADGVARAVGERLNEKLGQSIVIENRGGAAGNLGARAVAAVEARRPHRAGLHHRDGDQRHALQEHGLPHRGHHAGGDRRLGARSRSW